MEVGQVEEAFQAQSHLERTGDVCRIEEGGVAGVPVTMLEGGTVGVSKPPRAEREAIAPRNSGKHLD